MTKVEQAAANLSRFLLAEVTLRILCNLSMVPQHHVGLTHAQATVVHMHDAGLDT